jgi:hypothetical protein
VYCWSKDQYVRAIFSLRERERERKNRGWAEIRVGPITYPNSYSVKYIIATLKENQRGAVAYGGLIWPKAAAQMFYLFAFLFNCNKNLIPPPPKAQSQFYSVHLSQFISRHLLVCF